MQRARSRLITIVSVVAFVLAASSPGVAGSAEDPEMPDRAGDVDPLSLAGLKPGELEDVQGNASMFDIVHAYVTAENPSGMWFVLQVVDLDGGLQSPDRNVTTPTMHATFEIHFQAGGEAWFVRALLEPRTIPVPSPAPPPAPPVPYPYLAANFTLHKDDAEGTFVNQLFGAVSPQHEAVMAYVPKIMIGEPKVGDVMDGLYSVSLFRAQAMDHAPDGLLDPTAIDPANPLRTAIKPTFGMPYEFGQYPGSGAPAKLEFKAEGETTLSAKTGETIETALTLRNLGTKAMDVQIGTIDPRGWSIVVDPLTLRIEPGSSAAVVIEATPSSTAGSQGILRVMASSGYETQTVPFVLKHTGATGTAGNGATGPGTGSDGPDQSLEDRDDKEDAPFVAPLVVVALAVAVVAHHRRRQA